MPTVRSEITIQNYSTEVPKDNSMNVVHHTIADSGFNPAVDYQNHSNEISTLFSGHNTTTGSTFNQYRGRAVTVKVYDLADPHPRPLRATTHYDPTTFDSDSTLAPRNVALCLSFFATRNLPRQRGRIFIGPVLSSYTGLLPSSILYNMILDLGHGLFDIGGENVAHVVYSPTGATSHVITDYWVNNQWDTMRSRLEKETTRVRLHP